MGVSLPFLREIAIVTNTFTSSLTLALYYFFVQFSNKLGSPRKVSSTGESIHAAAIEVDAMFSRTTEHYSATKLVHGCVLFHLYAFIRLKTKKRAVFCAYKLRLNFCIVFLFSYLDVESSC